MTYEKLNYYQKIGDVASQILDIKEKARTGKKVFMLSMPSWFDSEQLVVFQFERIRTLEVATRCDEDEIRKWVLAIKQRSNLNEKEKFQNQWETQLLELGLT